jgi:DNA-binding Lrp family transcriptional regulator
VSLDRVDRALLAILARDARASGASLAASLGVAESTVSLRLRRLRSAGHIRGFRADLDLGAFGATLQALVSVRLGKHNRQDIDAFRAAAPHWPGVLAVFHMAGANDYLLHVVARDASELREFVLTYITGHPSVEHTETNLIFERADGTGWEQLLHP